MKISTLVLLAVAFMALALPGRGAAEPATSSLTITELAVTTKIVKGNPIDSVRRISSASVTALYCFTRLTAAEETDSTIKHVWYRDDVKVAEYDLPVKGRKWRTYSKKTISKGWAGDWRVDVLNEEGALLKSVKFRMN
jgi:DUF2914 family protein